MNIVELFILFLSLLFGLPVLGIIILIVVIKIKGRNEQKLYDYSKNSEKIQELNKLNSEYIKSSLLSKYEQHLLNRTIYAQVNTLGALDKYDYEWDLWNEVWENKEDYLNIISIFPMAKAKDLEYQRKYNEVLYKRNKYFKSQSKNEQVYQYELKIGDKIRIKELPIEVSLRIVINYTSLKGRNTDSRERIINEDKIKYYCTHEIIRKKYVYQDDAQVERGKMNESLRYDVFKRDGFRCCICGATAQDGAKLHVDHIIPVSKGGKTVMSNLQTLCDRCNRGKSNKL